MAEIMWGSKGAFFKVSAISSMVLPCECSSLIILSWNQKSNFEQDPVNHLSQKTSLDLKNRIFATKRKDLASHHERIPRHCGKQAFEELGGAQVVDDPVVAVDVDDGLVEIENHDRWWGHCWSKSKGGEKNNTLSVTLFLVGFCLERGSIYRWWRGEDTKSICRVFERNELVGTFAYAPF